MDIQGKLGSGSLVSIIYRIGLGLRHPVDSRKGVKLWTLRDVIESKTDR